jgi:hypothetical protein
MQALAAHGSQISDLGRTEALMRDVAETAGKKCGVRLAEGFLRIDVH